MGSQFVVLNKVGLMENVVKWTNKSVTLFSNMQTFLFSAINQFVAAFKNKKNALF